MRRFRRMSKARRERRGAFAAAAITAAAILALAATAVWLSTDGALAPTAPAAQEVLAVMPFRAVPPDPDNAYLGVGLAESIISRFSGVPGLTVRSLSASLGSSGDGAGAVEVGRRLDADAVIEGEYRLDRERYHVTARLVDVDNATTLWQHQGEGPVEGAIDIEQRIVDETLAAMLPELKQRQAAGGADADARVAAASPLYLSARGRMETLEARAAPEAIDQLEQAIAADPDYLPAHAALARACANIIYGSLSADPEWIDRAVAAGHRAVALDDRSSLAHYSFAYALLVAGDPVLAARETVAALRLDPRNAPALRLLALMRAGAGEAAPVRALRDAARQVDPSIQTTSVDLWITMIEGDYDHGVAELKQALEWRRTAGISQELPLLQLGYLAFESGDPVAGLRWSAMLETLPAARGHAEMIHLLALARMGDERGMENLVHRNFGLYSINWAACDVIGRAYALLGDKDEALRWLERSVARGAYDSGTWERSDTLDGLRGNERFESVLAIVKERSRKIVEIAEFAGYR